MILAAITKTNYILMLLGSFLLLVLACLFAFLYFRKLKKSHAEKNQFSNLDPTMRYAVYTFWGHILYIFLVFVCVVGFLIFLGVSITGLINA